MVLNQETGHIGSPSDERAAKVTIPVQDKEAAGRFFAGKVSGAGMAARFVFLLTNLPGGSVLSVNRQFMTITFVKPLSAALITLILLNGCASNEIGQSSDVDPGSIHQGYLVDHDEKSGRTVITAQFRFAGPAGTTLVLNPPSRFLLDGQAIPADSSSLSGAYYRVELPAEKGSGNHRLQYVDRNGREYINSAAVVPFRFSAVPRQVSRNSPACIGLEFPPLEEGDQIELYSVDTDSSFTVTRYSRDTGTFICIPTKELRRQQQQSFSVYAVLSRRRSTRQHTAEGGEISIQQSLKPVEIRFAD